MDFLVTGTFQLNDNAYVLLKFRNVNGNADVTAKNLTGSGTVNITEVAEQLVVQPSSMRAGAFLISYSTEDLGEPESPTEATGKRKFSEEFLFIKAVYGGIFLGNFYTEFQ
ncbi:hypothetical protein OESDEN_23399 [Oesophagostomum dentatum]|uniref:Uncharacterized protein n=1 Tax=Oesophagostomum dentatum TaxID=61180 RepID=A0A0B1RZ99_OESDE|nr:hypothetical protein OESDEN_23399 [Oesophagostomum dentatum]